MKIDQGQYFAELPPHTRRRDFPGGASKTPLGTTSAYAEKRSGWGHLPPLFGNYLRIRGEESAGSALGCVQSELPPHTRRRAPVCHPTRTGRGTTSAYAEKSLICRS